MLGEPDNGNFLGLVELLAKYDPFLRKYTVGLHVKKLPRQK